MGACIISILRPGKPTDNALAGPFNGSFQDERLNVNWFLSLEDARDKIKAWMMDYNEYRPHSSLENMTPSDFARATTKKEAEKAAWTSPVSVDTFKGKIRKQKMACKR